MTDEQKKALKEAAEGYLGGYEKLPDPPTILALLADLERLEGIVAKLPRTADGVPVVPGVDQVWWHPENATGDEYHHISIGCGGFAVAWQFLPDSGDSEQVRVAECYSTEAAARAALAREVPND